jgi:hypothetical protein
MANRFTLCRKGLTPMMVCDDPTPPLPEALWRVQCRRVGGLGLAQALRRSCTDAVRDGRALVLSTPVMHHQAPLPGRIDQPMAQARRTRLVSQRGAHVVVGASGQGGDRPIAMHRGVVIPGRPLGYSLDQAPLRRPRRVAPPRVSAMM